MCRKTLAAELNIEPMEETQALFMEVSSNQVSSHTAVLYLPRPADSLKQAIQDLETAVRQLDAARFHLDQVLQNVSQLVTHPELTEQVQRIQKIIHR
jgi:hypothetical protein